MPNQIFFKDIKGANILVDNAGTIKLADFGAAQQLSGKSFKYYELRLNYLHIRPIDIVSYVTSVTGTPYWMAPEVIQGNVSYGRKADIWSLGAVVIEMTTGKPPFYDLPPMTAMFKLGSSDILPDIPEHLSDEAKDFLKQCFQR